MMHGGFKVLETYLIQTRMRKDMNSNLPTVLESILKLNVS